MLWLSTNSGSLNIVEPQRPSQAGTELPLLGRVKKEIIIIIIIIIIS
jgi:hypothetical protein